MNKKRVILIILVVSSAVLLMAAVLNFQKIRVTFFLLSENKYPTKLVCEIINGTSCIQKCNFYHWVVGDEQPECFHITTD